MPSSTPERQNRWLGDTTPIRFLLRYGYFLNADWTWSCARGREPTWLEKDAILYLIEEWDFGGLLTADDDARRPMPRSYLDSVWRE